MDNLDFSSLFDFSQSTLGSSFSIVEIALSLMITFLIALFIYFVYKKTYTGVLYSKNFNITLVMTAMVVNAIMIGISGNIVLSLGMVGALSIVRFRTAIKDPKDTAFIFWAITIGIINGVAYYELSIIASLFIATVLFFLSQANILEPAYVLIIKYTKNINSQIEPILNKFCSKHYIRSDSRENNTIEKVIEVRLKKKAHEQLLENMRNIEGIDKCILLASNGEIAE